MFKHIVRSLMYAHYTIKQLKTRIMNSPQHKNIVSTQCSTHKHTNYFRFTVKPPFNMPKKKNSFLTFSKT